MDTYQLVNFDGSSINQTQKAIMALHSLFKRGNVRVVGRTACHTARVDEIFLECERGQVKFLEDRLQDKDNYSVLIFQVLWGENGWTTGFYYAFLTDFHCLIGRELIPGDF